MRVAGRHRLDDRLVQVLATRAAVNQELGRPGAARRDLDRARAHAGRTASADLGLQRAVLDHNEGRLRQAAVLYEQLLDDPSTPPDIRVKAANNLALIESHHGDHTSALARLDAVTGVAAELGPALVAIVADSRGWVTVQSGRLVEGLRLLDEAADRHREAGLSLGEHYLEHSDALEDLRLLPEATRMATLARAEFAAHGVELLTGEAQLRLARLAGRSGDQAAAESAARESSELFRRQRRTSWAAYALVLEVQARARQGSATAADARAVRRAAQRLERAGMVSWATDGYLVAATSATGAGAARGTLDDLADAERLCRGGPALVRLKGHLAGARRAELAGNRAQLLGHARAGLVDLAEHRAALSSTELRALASGHGVELGRLALRALLAHGTPGEVLAAMERTRAAALLVAETPPVEGIEPLLAELRSVQEGLTAARSEDGFEPVELLVGQAALERRIRRASWLTPSAARDARVTVPLPELRRELAGRTLVEYAALDGDLVAVVVGARRSRLVRLGPFATVEREARYLLFALRRLALGSTTPAATAALGATAAAATARLRELLLEPLRLAPGEPLVVVPSSVTWRLPWAHLCAAPVSVAPSSASWLRTARRRGPTEGGVLLVAGPGLDGAAEEVAALGRLHAGSRVLAPPDSSVDAVVRDLGGARLAHLACHGRLRADNPTFSSFQLSSGDLTVHEIGLRGLAPYRVVLSACDSGADTTLEGDEFVGFISALLGQGTAGVLASCVQVSDRYVVPLMLSLHRRLLLGATMADALHAAAAEVDPEQPGGLAVRASFSAYGAA